MPMLACSFWLGKWASSIPDEMGLHFPAVLCSLETGRLNTHTEQEPGLDSIYGSFATGWEEAGMPPYGAPPASYTDCNLILCLVLRVQYQEATIFNTALCLGIKQDGANHQSLCCSFLVGLHRPTPLLGSIYKVGAFF